MTTRWARRTASAAVAACTLLLAGCGGADEQATIDWTNGLCSSYSTFRQAALVGPAPAADPQGQARSLATYLGDTATALDTSLADLDGLGAAPVEGGDQAVTKFRDQLTRYRDAFRQAHAQVQGLDLDSRSLPQDMEAAVAPVLSLQDTDQDPLAGLDSAVTNAASQAPACQDLSRLSGSGG